MTDWLVTGHAGAVEWARRRGITARHVPHLDVTRVRAGDRVLGTLPAPLAAAVCAAGAQYWHLSLDLPAAARRRELTCDDLDRFGARLRRYDVREVDDATISGQPLA